MSSEQRVPTSTPALPPVRAPRGEAPAARLQRPRVVLACPDPGLGDAVERILHHHAPELAMGGLEIRRVADGLTCLQEMQLVPPALAILHAGLGRMSVVEILQAWEASHPGEPLAVIVLSALFGRDVPAGMPGAVVVSLPFHNAELVSVVARALEERPATS